MVANVQFTSARQSRLYLKHAPIIAAANKGISDPTAFGFKHGSSRKAQKLRFDLNARLSGDLHSLNSSSSLGIPASDLTRFSRQIARSIASFKPGSLFELSKRGIVSPECAVALSKFQMVPTSDISNASMDMMLEYRNAKLPFKHQLLMIRRFLPLSYIEWMAKKYDAAMSDVIYFIEIKTFPHIELKKAIDIAKTLAEKYKDKDVTYSDAWRFAVHNAKGPEAVLLKAMRVAKSLAKKYKNKDVTYFDAWRFAVGNPKDPEAAILKAMKIAKSLAKKYKDKGVSYKSVWYFAVHNPKDPGAALLKAMDIAEIN